MTMAEVVQFSQDLSLLVSRTIKIRTIEADSIGISHEPLTHWTNDPADAWKTQSEPLVAFMVSLTVFATSQFSCCPSHLSVSTSEFVRRREEEGKGHDNVSVARGIHNCATRFGCRDVPADLATTRMAPAGL
jgi:hypothetical protein